MRAHCDCDVTNNAPKRVPQMGAHFDNNGGNMRLKEHLKLAHVVTATSQIVRPKECLKWAHIFDCDDGNNCPTSRVRRGRRTLMRG